MDAPAGLGQVSQSRTLNLQPGTRELDHRKNRIRQRFLYKAGLWRKRDESAEVGYILCFFGLWKFFGGLASGGAIPQWRCTSENDRDKLPCPGAPGINRSTTQLPLEHNMGQKIES